ncbi:MAG: hypothetical protein QNJ32_17025 [Xenococcaceae cyanobacterium MO_167.B27]|nr:hypothetical protein [Xenococcaceae cyanobacterium MO_167.B27]
MTSLTFSSDGKQLATASEGGIISLWTFPEESSSQDEQSSQPKILALKYGKDKTKVASLTFSPDGKQLATASETGFISLWSTEDESLWTTEDILKKPLISFRMKLPGKNSKKVLSANFVSDGSQFAIASEDGTISLWNFRNKQPNLDEDNLDDLLKRGCKQLANYLKTHPEKRRHLPCPASETKAPK